MPESDLGYSCQLIFHRDTSLANHQTVPYISPQQHAALLASLPRVWTAGLLLIGSVMTAWVEYSLTLAQLMLQGSRPRPSASQRYTRPYRLAC